MQRRRLALYALILAIIGALAIGDLPKTKKQVAVNS